MVRLLCQNFAVPCRGQSDAEAAQMRSILGTGDYIDEGLALRAVQAMSHSEDHNFSSESDSNFSNTESGSNSDSDGDHGALRIAEEDGLSIASNPGKEDQRKIRRRERNKVSAQAYRQRRKQQSSSQQKILDELEERQRELLQQVRSLEEQKTIVEELLKKKVKIPWPWPYHCPTGHPHPTTTTTGMTTAMETVTMDAPMSMERDVSVTS